LTVKPPRKPRQAAPVSGLPFDLLARLRPEERLRFAESFLDLAMKSGVDPDELFAPWTDWGQEVARLEAWIEEAPAAEVEFDGKHYYWRGVSFTPRRWKVWQVIPEEPGELRQSVIFLRAGVKGSRLSNLFKDHPAAHWIRMTRPGWYQREF
jgi:hypothetical protein